MNSGNLDNHFYMIDSPPKGRLRLKARKMEGMLKIGTFSKLSQLSIKTLRFYEAKELLKPASIDQTTNYRLYSTEQLLLAARIKAYRQLGFSLAEIKELLAKGDDKQLLSIKAADLKQQLNDLSIRLSIINHLLKEDAMNYQVTLKTIPETNVYYAEKRVHDFKEMMELIPQIGAHCQQLNPKLKVTDPEYNFCEYLDGEYKEKDFHIRYSESVDKAGIGDEEISFKKLPATKVLSIFVKGSYEQFSQAYAYLLNFAKANGYKPAGLIRESYIDGIWNKESTEDWLSEIQLPII